MAQFPPRHYCAQCNQQFTRNEHLQRHMVKHGVTRQFECEECFQRFNRRDVLRRHERTRHSDDVVSMSPTSGTQSHQNPRVAIACDECAKAKVRCNSRFPCSQCQRKSLVCKMDRPHPAVKRRKNEPFQVADELPGPSLPNANNAAHMISDIMWPVGPQVLPSACSKTASLGSPSNHEEMLVNLTNIPDSSSMNLLDELGGYDLNLLDFSWSFPWDVHTPRPQDGIINWPTGDHLLQAKPGEVSTFLDGPTEKVTDRRRGKHVLRTDGTINPYANCPFEYRFKRGPTVNAHRIYTFLHDQESWEQVKSSIVGFRTNRPMPRIVASLRDTIVARVHGMLYKLLDRIGFLHRFPPLDTIEHCYYAYQQTFSKLYPIVHPTSLLESFGKNQDPDSDIGLFLATTMALGCLVIPVEKARAFSVELVYLIRFTITDNAFQDEICLLDNWVLSAWIMMLAFSAWSGSKRHMEIAEAFKGIPTTYFLRRGYYKARPNSNPGSQSKASASWSKWINKERELRLCQILFLIDHEISLLHNVQPAIPFTRLQCPMPVSDELFFLDNEDQWRETLTEWAGDTNSSTKLHPPSLASFYGLFLSYNFFDLKLSVTPLQLRLLLCPIQTQVIQYSQRYRFVPMEEGFEPSTPVSETAEFVRLYQQEELEKSLVKWNLLSEQVFDGLPPWQSQTTPLLLCQLVWVELYICFDDVQLIAGKDGFEIGKTYLPQLRRWAQSTSAWKAIARAGNVIRILQSRQDRPVWWPIAVSRIALVMWCYTVGLNSPVGNMAGVNSTTSSAGPLIVLNDPARDGTSRGRNIHPRESIMCIQGSDGKHIPLYDVPRIFDFYIQMLDDSKSLNSPLLNSSRNFLQDIKDCGIPYAKAEDESTC